MLIYNCVVGVVEMRVKSYIAVLLLVFCVLFSGCSIYRSESTVPLPRFSTYPGYYAEGEVIEVVLTSYHDEAEIFYTLDGSRPTRKSRRYTEPISIVQTTEIRAIAYMSLRIPSEISGVFTFMGSLPEYSVGSVGPAGGTVFFDKGDYIGGWRYLEAAPETEVSDHQWVNGEVLVGWCDGVAIGEGLSNTLRLIDYFGERESASIAPSCYSLETKHNGKVFSDWFLPSLNELAELGKVVASEACGIYWTSSECTDELAYAVDIKTGKQLEIWKPDKLKVWPVRMF